MWDPRQYDETLAALGFEVERREDWSPNVARTYGAARAILRDRREEILRGGDARAVDAQEYESVMSLYDLWVERGETGDIGWYHWRARKPA